MIQLNLTCPFPENINPLSPNGFMFGVQHLPEMKYFCQQVNLPSISMPTVEQASPLLIIPHKGTSPSYDPLNIQFLVDSNMGNYKAILDWMLNGLPDANDPEKMYSDGFLQVLGSSNDIVRTIRFVDMTPISIDGVTFSSTNSDVQYVVGSATFRYTYFYFS